MRIDARLGDQGWDVWHVPECRSIDLAVWFDDQTAQYGAWDSVEQFAAASAQWQAGTLAGLIRFLMHGYVDQSPFINPPTHQAKRITVNVQSRLALIDPIDDEPADADERTHELVFADANDSTSHWCRPTRLPPKSPPCGARLVRPGFHWGLGRIFST